MRMKTAGRWSLYQRSLRPCAVVCTRATVDDECWDDCRLTLRTRRLEHRQDMEAVSRFKRPSIRASIRMRFHGKESRNGTKGHRVRNHPTPASFSFICKPCPAASSISLCAHVNRDPARSYQRLQTISSSIIHVFSVVKTRGKRDWKRIRDLRLHLRFGNDIIGREAARCQRSHPCSSSAFH